MKLLTCLEKLSQTNAPISSCSETEKGHGRVKERKYETYKIENEYFDERWESANFQTLVKVNRTIDDCKNKATYKEVAFYISNQTLKDKADVELAHAMRGHWKVETNNHIRDVTLKEDRQRTIKIAVTKMLATCRTLVINLLNQLKPENRVAQLELFSDDFNTLIHWLKEIKLL